MFINLEKNIWTYFRAVQNWVNFVNFVILKRAKASEPKLRQFNICITNTNTNTITNFDDFVSYSKQRKLLNQHLFQNIF